MIRNPSKKDKEAYQVKFYDLTASITSNTVVFPGDPCFKYEAIVSLDSGAEFNLCQMHLGNHTGTHIDFPSHVLKGGKTSSDFQIQDFIGTGLIIEVPETEISITKSFVASQQHILQNDFVFFKTSNSKLSKQEEFTEKYVYIEPDAAEELIQKGVKIVGIDYISVDSFETENLPVHHLLLLKDILIVEGLELNGVPVGRCKIYIIPNNIPGMDGLPARVIAEL